MCLNWCLCQVLEETSIDESKLDILTETMPVCNSRCICPRKRKEHEEMVDHGCKHTKSSNTIEVNMCSDAFILNKAMACEEARKEERSWNRGEKWNSVKQHEEKFMNMTKKKSNKSTRATQISKKLSEIKLQIIEVEKILEEEAGHPLSKADKLKDEELNKLMRKQLKLKKKQKELKEKEDHKENTPCIEKLKERVETNMEKIRSKENRPDKLEDMTPAEKDAEKCDLINQLEIVEEELGGIVTKENRQVLADLYLRLRQLKRSTRKPSYNGAFLTEIPEHESIQEINYSRRRSSVDSTADDDEEEEEETEEDDEDEEEEEEEEWHTMTELELHRALKGMREQKRSLGKCIKEFQQTFLAKTGRKVTKEDREPIKMIYKMYTKIKYRIRLVDALLLKYSIS